MSTETPAVVPPVTPSTRLTSLDAFRGAIMLLMASAGFGLHEIAKHFPDSAVWSFVGFHTEHVDWRGSSLWDFIQPAFMFMVGVALPWSIAKRKAAGQSFTRMFVHALWRSLLLVLLAVFLSSAWDKQTEWVFPNVLAQIGLGFPFLFLIAFASARTQWLLAFGILFVYWLAFALYPVPPASFDWASVGVKPEWSHLTGFAAHWEKNANFAAAFDVWFLNLFPRAEPFVYNRGGYQTLNFVPSLATMVFGLIAGRLLHTSMSMRHKLLRLLLTGAAGIALGLVLDGLGLCPIVKRIWTPSWAIFSAGWVTIMLAAFVAVVDWRGHRRWAFPLIVVGMNPITLYCMFQLSSGFILKHLRIHLGQDVFASFGELWIPLLERGSVLLVLWLVVWWMYRRKIFVRI